MHLSWNSGSTMLWLAPAEGTDAPADAPAPAATEERPGVIDVGRRGRLVGLEVRLSRESMRRWAADLPAHFFEIPVDGHIYLALDGEGSDEVRSAALTTTVEFDADGLVLRIGVPRRGPGWELSWPSGNE